jgi:hypothetical protein
MKETLRSLAKNYSLSPAWPLPSGAAAALRAMSLRRWLLKLSQVAYELADATGNFFVEVGRAGTSQKLGSFRKIRFWRRGDYKYVAEITIRPLDPLVTRLAGRRSTSARHVGFAVHVDVA